jgi:hypothetical protein
MRRPVPAMSVVIALVLATFGAFASGTGGLSADRRIPEVSSSPAVAAPLVVAAPAQPRGVPQRSLWALTTAMAAILAALFGFAALRPRRVVRVLAPTTQVRLRGPPKVSALDFNAS